MSLPRDLPQLDSIKLMRVQILIKSWESSCETINYIITKGKNICVKQWMLTNDHMEALGMPIFDELVHIDPTKLNIGKVDEQRDQATNKIQNISQRDISSFRLFIATPTQLQVNLQGFLNILSTIHFNKITSLLCKDRLQLEHTSYPEVINMLEVYSKWKEFLSGFG